MTLKRKSFSELSQLRAFLKEQRPLLWLSSQTSTVIPYEKLEKIIGKQEITLADLASLPKSMKLNSEDLIIEGPVTWKEAREYCRSQGRDILMSPTEENACVLAGVATSATGERSFGFGPFRDHLKELEFIDGKGETHRLFSKNVLKFEEKEALLENYRRDYSSYKYFKNGPFPRLEKETDLVCGMEGQLGVVTKAILQTRKYENYHYLFILLPLWEENDRPHLEFFEKVQAFRGDIVSCEFIDHNSLSFVSDDIRPASNQDLIYLEVLEDRFEFVNEKLISKLESIDLNSVFEIASKKCHQLRLEVPRAIAEENAKKGIIKKGTDTQVGPHHFRDLLDFYRGWSQSGIRYNLFGHFGDGHLHFNFLPLDELESTKCQNELLSFYQRVKLWKGSPFAEHGVGLIKQDFIKPFYGKNQFEMFKFLKKKYDPNNILFPLGFMNL